VAGPVGAVDAVGQGAPVVGGDQRGVDLASQRRPPLSGCLGRVGGNPLSGLGARMAEPGAGGVAAAVPGGDLGQELGEGDVGGGVQPAGDVAGPVGPVLRVAGGDDGQGFMQRRGGRQVGEAFVDEGVGQRAGVVQPLPEGVGPGCTEQVGGVLTGGRVACRGSPPRAVSIQ